MKQTDDVRHLIRELRSASWRKKPSGFTMRRSASMLETLHDELSFGDRYAGDCDAGQQAFYEDQITNLEEQVEGISVDNLRLEKQLEHRLKEIDDLNAIIAANSKVYNESLLRLENRVAELHGQLTASIVAHIDTKLGDST